jgi:S-DNA-T family DNA segregation ATPase FtsK/SpoIIIE
VEQPPPPQRPAAPADADPQRTTNARLLDLARPHNVDFTALGRTRPIPQRYRIPLGSDGNGRVVELDFKETSIGGAGPHGLVVGFIGSGKTELLRWAALMAMRHHSPSELTVALIGSPSLCEDLDHAPHTVFTADVQESSLQDLVQLRRTLERELRRRIGVLQTQGVKNCWDLAEAAPEHAFPKLLIVLGMADDVLRRSPRLLSVLNDIGRIGRAAGIHLLLAAQRPLDDSAYEGFLSHLSYRVGLKTFTAEDSEAVLGTEVASELPGTGGHGYLKTPMGIERFRAPYPDEPAGNGDQSVLQALVRTIAAQTPPAPRLEEAPLAPPIGLRQLPDFDGTPLTVHIGRLDRPSEVDGPWLGLDLSGRTGHVAVAGGLQSGKSTTLRTLVLALARHRSPERIRFHCLDFSGGRLSSLSELAHVDSVSRPHPDTIDTVVRNLHDLLASRDELFARRRIDSLAELRHRADQGVVDEPTEIFVVVDSWNQLRHPEPLDAASRVAESGNSLGVHLLLSTDHWDDLPEAVGRRIHHRLELRLDEPERSEIDPKLAGEIPHSTPGIGGYQFQIALAPTRQAGGRRVVGSLAGPEQRDGERHRPHQRDVVGVMPHLSTRRLTEEPGTTGSAAWLISRAR